MAMEAVPGFNLVDVSGIRTISLSERNRRSINVDYSVEHASSSIIVSTGGTLVLNRNLIQFRLPPTS